jgi:competence protein ComEC
MAVVNVGLKRVPILPFALCAVAGVLLALYSEIAPEHLLVACILVALLAAISLAIPATRSFAVALVLLFTLLLAFYRAEFALGRDVRRKVENLGSTATETTVIGTVSGSAIGAHATRVIVLSHAILSPDSAKIDCGNLRVRLLTDSASLPSLAIGDVIHARGRLKTFSETAMSSVGSLVGGLVRLEVATIDADSDGSARVKAGGHVMQRVIERLRNWIIASFDRRLGPDAAALCKALVLGDRGDFGRDFSDDLRLTGLSHIFALSGMNVGVLISLFWVLFACFMIPHGPRLWILLILVLLYMELGLEAASLVRASLMAIVFLLGKLIFRRIELANSIAVAAFVELLWRPLDILDAGFVLSYLSVLGIVAGSMFIRERLFSRVGATSPRWIRMSADVISVTLATQVATTAAVGVMFHRMPLIGAIGNVFAVPAFAILLLWSVALLIAEATLSVLASLMAPALDASAYVLGKLVSWLGAVPLASVSLPPMSFVVVALACAGMAAMLVGLYLSRRALIAGSGLFVGATFVWGLILAPVKPVCELSFISVGNGDATLVSSANGHHVLVDAGPVYGDWSAARQIASYLKDRNVRRLDALILTHSDNDHIGGAAELLGRVPISRVFYNEPNDRTSRACLDLDLAMSNCGVLPEGLIAGQRITLSPDVSLITLSPDSDRFRSSALDNQQSIVLQVESPHVSALLTADIDSTVESQLEPWGNRLSAGLLKVAHHGSKASTSSDFLRRVAPEFAAISCGRRNHYGHPDPAVLRRLKDAGVQSHITSREGTLRFAALGGRWVPEESLTSELMRIWKLPRG